MIGTFLRSCGLVIALEGETHRMSMDFAAEQGRQMLALIDFS